MFENSSEETAYHKLLILYILYKITACYSYSSTY